MRDRYLKNDKLTPKRDLFIWVKEINNLTSDIKYSLERVTTLIATLKKLREDCVRTGDDLEACLDRIEVGLKKRIAEKKIKIKNLEEQIKNAGCSWW